MFHIKHMCWKVLLFVQKTINSLTHLRIPRDLRKIHHDACDVSRNNERNCKAVTCSLTSCSSIILLKFKYYEVRKHKCGHPKQISLFVKFENIIDILSLSLKYIQPPFFLHFTEFKCVCFSIKRNIHFLAVLKFGVCSNIIITSKKNFCDSIFFLIRYMHTYIHMSFF